jgi:hypothetical protein
MNFQTTGKVRLGVWKGWPLAEHVSSSKPTQQCLQM